MNGQASLNNFYQSLKFNNPSMADLMGDDILNVSLYALSDDKTPGQAAAERLRQHAVYLPEILRRVLESALIDLGYS
jgi:hypothetical protein